LSQEILKQKSSIIDTREKSKFSPNIKVPNRMCSDINNKGSIRGLDVMKVISAEGESQERKSSLGNRVESGYIQSWDAELGNFKCIRRKSEIER